MWRGLVVVAALWAMVGEEVAQHDKSITPDTPGDRLLTRDVAIEGCMAWVGDIKTTGNVPAWIEKNKELLRDLDLKFRKDNYPNGRHLLNGSCYLGMHGE